MGKLTDKVAVVTGASKGIGAAIAKELAAQGAAVVVNYASSKEGAARVIAEIVSAGGKAAAVGGNIARAAEVEALFAEARRLYGKIDILVNNAGVYAFTPLDTLTTETIASIFDVNVAGCYWRRRQRCPCSRRRVAPSSTSARSWASWLRRWAPSIAAARPR